MLFTVTFQGNYLQTDGAKQLQIFHLHAEQSAASSLHCVSLALPDSKTRTMAAVKL